MNCAICHEPFSPDALGFCSACRMGRAETAISDEAVKVIALEKETQRLQRQLERLTRTYQQDVVASRTRNGDLYRTLREAAPNHPVLSKTLYPPHDPDMLALWSIYIAMERTVDKLRDSIRRLEGHIDDMQHDFGVIAFCGLSMSKNDKESFRSEDAIPALQTLEQERDKRITLDNELEQAQGEIAALLEYAKNGRCADEECSDMADLSENGLALFEQLRMLTDEEQVSAFLSGEVKRLDGEVKPMKEALTLIAEGRMHEYFETHPVSGIGLFLNPAQVIARAVLARLYPAALEQDGDS